MAKSVSKPKTGFYVVIGILLVLAAIFAALYAQTLSSYAQTQGSYSSVKYTYSVLQSNYNTLKSNYTTEKVNFSSLQATYNNLSEKYNITEYNLTHPYIKILANKQVVSIPPETYNYTTGFYEAPSYNFSFSAPYPGYLVVNYTVSPINNNLTNGTFFIYVSTQKPYYSGGVLATNEYIAPVDVYTGPNGQTAILPIVNGTNYVLLSNFYYNQTVTAEFSIKYFGFHTS